MDLCLQFDELLQCYRVLLHSSCEEEFLRFLSQQKLSRVKYEETTNECRRLKGQIEGTNKDISLLNDQLNSARGWLDAARQQRKKAEADRDCVVFQFKAVQRILLTDPWFKMCEENKRKLQFLYGTARETLDRLNTIAESDSAMSSSDVSFSRSDNDLDNIPRKYTQRKHRLSCGRIDENVVKKQKVTGTSGDFSIQAVESLKPDPLIDPASMMCNAKKDKYALPAVNEINARAHNFVKKGLIMPETCFWCSKKMVFGRSVFKCSLCKAVVHTECRDKLPLPCVPLGTPTKKSGGTISDHAPATSPMIPPIVIHCVNEIERRGLKEMGIYRVCGTEAESRRLRDKFSKNEDVPCLDDDNVHSICGCLKDFLRNLQDSLITRARWEIFANAIAASDKDTALRAAVYQLPPANRDTLAFLILHLQNVAAAQECKMSISNLATIFGPTVVGYANNGQSVALSEIHTSIAIVEHLLSLPNEYWNKFILKQSVKLKTPATIHNAVSTNNTAQKSSRKFLFTPEDGGKFFSPLPILETPATIRDAASTDNTAQKSSRTPGGRRRFFNHSFSIN